MNRAFLGLFLTVFCAAVSFAQIITTIAGNIAVSDGLKARQTLLVGCRAVAAGSDGSVYIADDGSRTVRRIDPLAGNAFVVAGGGTLVDDLVPIGGKSAYLNSPAGLAVSSRGVYIADRFNHRVRLLLPGGQLTTVAGNGTSGYSGDGSQATRAQLTLPSGLAVDAAGNLFIADRGNRAIRRVDAATGTITTPAGGPLATGDGDGIPAHAAKLNVPTGVAVDAAGNLFVSDTFDQVVRKIEASGGLIRTVAGNGLALTSGDGGPATSAGLEFPQGIAVAPNGDLYIGQLGRVRRVSASTGAITTVLGGGLFPLAEGPSAADVFIPGGIEQMFLAGNNLLLAIPGGHVIAALDLRNLAFSVLAGDPLLAGNLGPALTAAVAAPQKLALDPAGNLYIADTFHHGVRRVAPGPGGPGTGTVTPAAGNGAIGVTGDGAQAAFAALVFPQAVYVDAARNIYFSDNQSTVRRVGVDGFLRTVAGVSGFLGFAGDGGPAASALLNRPLAITGDATGSLYIADAGNHRVRKVEPSGVIRTVAGTGTPGYGGDGGSAAAALLNSPSDLLLDGRDGLLVADTMNHRVRRINLAGGIITTVAGNGAESYSGDGGPAPAAGLYRPAGLASDPAGNLYVTMENVIRRIDAVTGIITTVAGVGDPGFTGDGGLATLARLAGPEGIVVDAGGNLIFADRVNSRVRRVSAAPVAPSLAVVPDALSFTATEGGASPPDAALRIITTNLVNASWTATVGLAGAGGWLALRPASGVTPASMQVAVDSSRLAPGSYKATITVSAAGATNSPQSVPATITVTPAGAARLKLDRESLSFHAVEGGASPAPQTIALTNAGGGVLQWSAAAETTGGGNWLSVSPSGGTGAATVTASATTGSLAAGVYQGQLVFRNKATGEGVPVAVLFVVGRPVSSLALSQTGLLLSANEGATFIPPQSVQVINAGQGALEWKAEAGSGSDWLTISPATGTSAAGSASALLLSASPAGLRAGVYDALVTVTAPGAANSPQTVLVRLSIRGQGEAPAGAITPGGVAIVATVSGPVQRESLTLTTTGGANLNFVASASTSDGAPWLSVSPAGGTLLGSAESTALTVQANPGQLAAGVYRGKVTVAFGTGAAQDVGVLLFVRPAGASPASATGSPEHQGETAEPCTPRAQFPFHVALPDNFSLPLGWPTPVIVRVLENCGGAVSNSVVVLTFSNGEEALPLRPAGNGVYTGTWSPSRPGSTTVTVSAYGSGLETGRGEPVRCSIGPAGGLAASRTPLIFRNGAVHAATFKRFAPLPVGGIFSSFGTNLGRGSDSAGAIPLPRSLAGVSAKLAGRDLPLYFAADGQLNAQVPFDLPPGGTFPLVATVGGISSPPELVTLTKTQPGIFTVDSSGSGVGVITDAEGRPVNGSNPASRGRVVVVYAAGLGMTIPPVASGEASPANPPARVVDAVTAFVGGIPATVEFAGLTPGLVGLYQVNVRIPDNAPVGEAVELYLEQNQVPSNRVTLAIR